MPKFQWRKGDKLLLYGLQRLKKYKDDFAFLVEGESDCHTLWLNNIPATGLPGANNWNEARDAHFFDRFKAVYVAIEPDKGGETVLKWLKDSSIKKKARLIFMDDSYNDISGLWLASENKEDFTARLTDLQDNSIPYSEYEEKESKRQSSEAWEACQGLAKEKDILNEVIKGMQIAGVTGEGRVIKLLFLALISRFLERPISVVLKGPSSAGKSFILDSVLKLFQTTAFYQLTAMSDRALAYSEEPLAHRFLILAEAGGLNSDFQSYLIRTLLSEGRIDYEFVEKTKDGLQARRVTKEGPTGFFCTTTAINLHPENETRMLSLTIKDTPEQTKNILYTLAKQDGNQAEGLDFTKWHSLQTWLSAQTNKVIIPYATELAKFIPPVALRLRRDFTLLLNMIKSHAILHQASRSKNERGYIIATLEDYSTVYGLVNSTFSDGLEATVSPAIRETVETVQVILEGKEGDNQYVKASELGGELNLDRSAINRRLRQAQKRGFLRNSNPGKGRVAQYVLGDKLPEDIQVLPTPEYLTTCAPMQTYVLGNAQVAQAKSADKSSSSDNLCTCASETEGIKKHTYIPSEVTTL